MLNSYQNGYYSQQPATQPAQQPAPQTYAYTGQQQPVDIYRQRLSFMEQQQQAQQQPPQQQQNIKTVAVTSVDEARAYPIPFENGIYVFLNMSDGKIYTKQFDFQTGGSHFREYSPVIPADTAETTQAIQEEPKMEAPTIAPQEDINMLKDEITALRKEVESLKGEINGYYEHNRPDGTKQPAVTEDNADVADSTESAGTPEPDGTK